MNFNGFPHRRRSSFGNIAFLTTTSGLGNGGNANAHHNNVPISPVSCSHAVPNVPPNPVSPSSTVPLSKRLSLSNLALSFSSSAPVGGGPNVQQFPAPLPVQEVTPATSPVSSPSGSDTTPRGIADLFSIFKRDRSTIWWGFAETDETKRLDALLNDRDWRNDLVAMLLASHSDYVIPVRFITSHSEYLNTVDKKEKQLKGKKILSTFFASSSMFQIRCIPDDDLCAVRLEHLGMVRVYLLTELLRIPLVYEHISSPNPVL
jgi:hypothetical protein